MTSRHPPAPASSEIVTVNLTSHPPSTPLGVLLAPASSSTTSPDNSRVTIVAGWEHTHSTLHRLGPIQRSGQVRLGDRLVSINNVDCTGMTFREVMDLLRGMIYREEAGGSPALRSMGFIPWNGGGRGREEEKEGNRSLSWGGAAAALSSGASLNSFTSSIHRARVRTVEKKPPIDDDAKPPSGGGDSTHDESSSLSSSVPPTTEKKRTTSGGIATPDATDVFVEYEIACHLKLRYHQAGGINGYRIGGEAEERTWSVWKRYSEFKSLDTTLRTSYGWQIDALNDGRGLKFPPSHVLSSLFGGTLDPTFVERRRKELESYWQAIQSIDGILDVTNPTSNRYSRDLALFLSVERQLQQQRGRGNPNSSSQWTGTSVGAGGEINTSSAPLGLGQQQQHSVSLSSLSSPSPPPEDGAVGSEQQPMTIPGDGVPENGGYVVSGGSVSMPNTTGGRGKERRKKRISGAAKPAFQRRLMQMSDPS